MELDKHPLKETAQRVLEDWAMMLTDCSDPTTKIFELDQPIFLSEISFCGAVKGRLSILAHSEFLENLTVNLLGLDRSEQVAESDKFDAFREMANVLAGNFVTAAYGSDLVIDLLNQEVRVLSDDQSPIYLDKKVIFSFLADDSPVAVSFELEVASDD